MWLQSQGLARQTRNRDTQIITGTVCTGFPGWPGVLLGVTPGSSGPGFVNRMSRWRSGSWSASASGSADRGSRAPRSRGDLEGPSWRFRMGIASCLQPRRSRRDRSWGRRMALGLDTQPACPGPSRAGPRSVRHAKDRPVRTALTWSRRASRRSVPLPEVCSSSGVILGLLQGVISGLPPARAART